MTTRTCPHCRRTYPAAAGDCPRCSRSNVRRAGGPVDILALLADDAGPDLAAPTPAAADIQLDLYGPAAPGRPATPPPADRTLAHADPTPRAEPAAEPGERPAYLDPPRRPDEVGRLGGYRVLKRLGAGGMGVVFLAEDDHLRRPVAVKVLRPELARDPAARERFLREARAAAALDHDHVVTIYHVGEAGGSPYLVMPYLRGRPLDAHLTPGRPMPAADAARLGREAALGLAAAHDRGMVHRDVKPANLWLEERSGPGWRVKVLDFGLARSSGDAALTHDGAVLGTPAYMAPEQARDPNVDFRADLFSLGCVLYEAATGRRAFQGPNVISTLASVALDEPPPPRQVASGLPAALSELIVRLLCKDPARRPASAARVAEALGRIG